MLFKIFSIQVLGSDPLAKATNLIVLNSISKSRRKEIKKLSKGTDKSINKFDTFP